MAEINDLRKELESLAQTDIFEVSRQTERFVGNPFKIDFDKTSILTCDDWKYNVDGIAQGCFLLAFYENDFGDEEVHEALLIRAIRPCSIPSDSSVISSRIEYFKEELKTAGKNRQIDQFTRFEFSCSGLECSILGTFYKKSDGSIEFGADLENFYSPHLYKVYKPSGKYLKYIVNLRDSNKPLSPDSNYPIGEVRYSSSERRKVKPVGDTKKISKKEGVLLHSKDVLGKRTALFGMTRTGKSNTVKILIEATTNLSEKAPLNLQTANESLVEKAKPFTEKDVPKYPVGQIIFDINGEYANKNLQDGTAIFEKYSGNTERYSILDKKEDGFKIMKVNFYSDIITGFEYILQFLIDDNSDYLTGFKVIDFSRPTDKDFNGWNIYNKHKSIYFCCLEKAGFSSPDKVSLKVKSNAEIDALLEEKKVEVDPENMTISEAYYFWETIWKNRDHECFEKLKRNNKGKDWLTEEIRSLLVMLFQKKETGQSVSGYQKFKVAKKLHTNSTDSSFQKDIVNFLRKGKIVIVDLSQGNPQIQRIFSEKICQSVFDDSMRNFIDADSNNFIQFYFEEAHNLFPKKDDKDLSQVYNRIAKEGAKLNLGMVYATQEVSSISSNILKNTQNWFIAHLNNEDEIRELRKFYDFRDFADALIRFSAKNDKGFVRMKTYSNPFVVPIQVEHFK